MYANLSRDLSGRYGQTTRRVLQKPHLKTFSFILPSFYHLHLHHHHHILRPPPYQLSPPLSLSSTNLLGLHYTSNGGCFWYSWGVITPPLCQHSPRRLPLFNDSFIGAVIDDSIIPVKSWAALLILDGAKGFDGWAMEWTNEYQVCQSCGRSGHHRGTCPGLHIEYAMSILQGVVSFMKFRSKKACADLMFLAHCGGKRPGTPNPMPRYLAPIMFHYGYLLMKKKLILE